MRNDAAKINMTTSTTDSSPTRPSGRRWSNWVALKKSSLRWIGLQTTTEEIDVHRVVISESSKHLCHESQQEFVAQSIVIMSVTVKAVYCHRRGVKNQFIPPLTRFTHHFHTIHDVRLSQWLCFIFYFSFAFFLLLLDVRAIVCPWQSICATPPFRHFGRFFSLYEPNAMEFINDTELNDSVPSEFIDFQDSLAHTAPLSDHDMDDDALGNLLAEVHRDYADYRRPEDVSVSPSSMSVMVDRTEPFYNKHIFCVVKFLWSTRFRFRFGLGQWDPRFLVVVENKCCLSYNFSRLSIFQLLQCNDGLERFLEE